MGDWPTVYPSGFRSPARQTRKALGKEVILTDHSYYDRRRNVKLGYECWSVEVAGCGGRSVEQGSAHSPTEGL